MAYSPDGSRIVSGSRDKTIRQWDAAHELNIAIHLSLGWARWDGRRVVPGSASDDLFQVRVFPMNPYRRDTLSLLGNADIPVEERARLEMLYFAEGGHTASARKLWKRLEGAADIDISERSPIRLRYLWIELDALKRQWETQGDAKRDLLIPEAVTGAAMSESFAHTATLTRLHDLIRIAATHPEAEVREGGLRLLASLAISYQRSGKSDEAVEQYRMLIEADVKWTIKKTIDDLTWPEIETIPLEKVRAATLEKHPELAPKED